MSVAVDRVAVDRVAERRPLVALAGNPNTGKTLLFNRLTGSNARVGNYPGITVERRVARGELPGGMDIELLDVPGAYSLSARSAEEQVAIRSLLGWGVEQPDLVVLVVDATQLLRNLYMVLQVRELGLPCVIALNMIDEVDGPPPDSRSIEALFKVPCVAVSARTRQGIDKLRETIAHALRAGPPPPFRIDYPDAVEADLRALTPLLQSAWQIPAGQARAMALWALTSLDDDDELVDIPVEVREAVLRRRRAAAGRDLDQEIIGTRYAWLDAHGDDLAAGTARRTLTARVDRVLLHPVAGFAVFLMTMLIVFQALFSWSDPFITAIEGAFDLIAGLARSLLPASVLTDLFVEGIIGGVGNVVVFLPQILLLFFFVGVMEDSGYMARAAYLMDRVMKAIGLHGRAFVPMLSGYACAVPAIMATRTMERQRDRLLTMMVIPFMTCSARLPVYTLIIAALFPPRRVLGFLPLQGLMMMAMYLFGTGAALVAAAVLGRTVLRGERVPLLLELPPIRVPSAASVLRLMTSRGKVFLTDAGTVILACTVLLWGLLSFPRLPEPGPDATADDLVAYQADSLEASYAGQLGRAIEPAIAPLGFDWKIGVGLIGAFAAREVFVSTMGLVYGVGGEVTETSTSLRDRMKQSRHEDGRPVYTPLVGLSLMVFIALAAQCMSTLAAVKRETGGYRWPAFLFVYMTATAWLASLAVYQAGRLLGLG